MMSNIKKNVELRVYENIIDAIGWTPLVRLHKIVPKQIKSKIYVKLEFMNPGGSVKDRVGIAMLKKAEQEGLVKPGMVIVEPTSGNTGVGLAIACAQMGYKLVVTMPDKMSEEKRSILRAYGAEVVICPTNVDREDPRSYYKMADSIATERRGFVPNQYFNPANPEVHYLTTGPEIWQQSDKKITHFVATVGTGGTITGTGKYLKEQNPNIKVIGGDPIGSILTEAWKSPTKDKYNKNNIHPYKLEGAGEDFIPETLDLHIIDDMIKFSDDEGFIMTRKLAREEGILTGGSGGAAVHCALKLAETLRSDAYIAVLLPDSGSRYVSKIFNNEWLKNNNYSFI